MITFALILLLFVGVVGFGADLDHLRGGKYPRQRDPVSANLDAVGLCVSLIFVVVATVALWVHWS